MYAVVVAGGGGPAGLNAALMLGRVRRRVLLADSGQQNAAAAAVHGFPSWDGGDPAELRCIDREQLAGYPAVRLPGFVDDGMPAMMARVMGGQPMMGLRRIRQSPPLLLR